MLYRIHKHVYAMYIHHSDGDGYAAKVHVWPQILCHSFDKNVFLVFAVALPQQHFVDYYVVGPIGHVVVVVVDSVKGIVNKYSAYSSVFICV